MDLKACSLTPTWLLSLVKRCCAIGVFAGELLSVALCLLARAARLLKTPLVLDSDLSRCAAPGGGGNAVGGDCC